MSEQKTRPNAPVSLSENPVGPFRERSLWGADVTVYRQRVDRVSIMQLEDGFMHGNADFPHDTAPHEISFELGDKIHRIWSAAHNVGRYATTNMVLEAARKKGLPIYDKRQNYDDEEHDFWVHTQYDQDGLNKKFELLDADAYSGLILEDGQPLVAGSPDTIKHLQVAHYEGEEWARHTS